MDDRSQGFAKVIVILYIVVLVPWTVYFSVTGISGKQTSTFPSQSLEVLIAFVLMLAAPLILVGIWLLRSTVSLGLILAALTSGVIAALVSFSAAYWAIGTTANFNIKLTHFDGWYIALGMFTAAGTGNIVAISDRAREIQTLQMVFDMTIIVFVAGILVARFSESFQSRRRNGASAHHSETANPGSPEEEA
jgi:hypothetical protein